MSARHHSAVHVDLDGAWADLSLPKIDATAWGPHLRFSTSAFVASRFLAEISPRLADFIVYGSGDFHHLTALWLQRVTDPVTLVSFDNHPDWDVRPPPWSCGGWINRALELPQLARVMVWGCGNFECWWPHQIFANRKAEWSGKLAVHPWADDRPPRARRRRGAILRRDWRELFDQSAHELAGRNIYVTIDLDCLSSEFAWTNWENGRFTLNDVSWALETLRRHARIIAGDICGAYSAPIYARRKQRFVSELDHPKLQLPSLETMRATNHAAFAALWPRLAQ